MRPRYALVLVGIGLLAWASSSVFTVDWTEYVYVTHFGRWLATVDGQADAGLHCKWPWPIESVQRVDRRLHILDLPATELVTRDTQGKTIDRTITVSAYASWRIADADGVDHFIRTVGTAHQAEMILGQRINSQLGSEITNMRLDELVSARAEERVADRLDRISRRLLEQAGPDARRKYGIELVDIRVRRFNYPAQVRDAIFERIRSERNKKAAEYLSEGDRLAKDIQSEAELKARNILTEAKAKEVRLKGEAEAEGDRIRNEAHSKDVAFYTFLKKLEQYQRILGDNKTVLLLSSHRELFDLLFKPPDASHSPPPVNSIAGSVSPKQAPKNGKQ